jgi:hypothetical protein
MVHLLYLRVAHSFVYCSEAIYGQAERIQIGMDNRKYPTSQFCDGENTMFDSTMVFHNTRIKKDSLPELIRDLGVLNLNPENNKITLLDIYRKNIKLNRVASVGRTFLIIMWIMKWVNRKYLTSTILFILGLLTLQFWLWIICLLILFNPIKPLPSLAAGDRQLFDDEFNWSYHIGFGYLNDPTVIENVASGEKQVDVL